MSINNVKTMWFPDMRLRASEPTHITLSSIHALNIHIEMYDAVMICPVAIKRPEINNNYSEASDWITGCHVWYPVGHNDYYARCFIQDESIQTNFRPITHTDLLAIKFDI